MVITEENRGLRKAQRINFIWKINDYNIENRYTNKIECGKTIIKMLMDPCYINGKVEGASPHIMFDDVEGIEKSGKEFSILVKHGFKYESSFGFIGPLKLKQRYSICNGMFLETFNYIRFLENRKILILEFEILIVNDGYEKPASFDDTKYSKDLQAIFDNKVFCDCEFDVNGTVIMGHKFVMAARAPKLLKAIEDAGDKLTIKDSSINGFNEFLRYLYCAKMTDKSDKIVFDVLCLAHAYNVQYLMKFCEAILANNLNAANANSIYQRAHNYGLSDELKQKSFALIQVMFKNINQKLPDEFINDPKYVDNLITLAESLINGLKKKDLNHDQAFIQASPSVKQLKVENAINEIVKEAESLHDDDHMDDVELAGENPAEEYDQEVDMNEFSSMENYVQNMSEIMDEELEYEEFAENIPELSNERFLDVIIEEEVVVSKTSSEQSIGDESEQNKTFDIGSESLKTVINNRDGSGHDMNSEDNLETVTVDVKFSDEVDEVEGPAHEEDAVTEIQKDMDNIEKFIIQVTDEVGTVVEKVYGHTENDVMDDCSSAEMIAEQVEKFDESVPTEKLQVDIQIVKDFAELVVMDEKIGETSEITQEEV